MMLGSSQGSVIQLKFKGRCRSCNGSGRDHSEDEGCVSTQLACFLCLGHGVETHDLMVGDLCIEHDSSNPFIYLGRTEDEHWFLQGDHISGKVSKCFGSHIVRSRFIIISRFEEATDA